MGSVTLRPNGTLSIGANTSIGGGAASHQVAQSDNLDTTYSSFDADNRTIDFQLTTFAFPALSQIKSITPRIRIATVTAETGNPSFGYVATPTGDPTPAENLFVPTTSIVTYTGPTKTNRWDGADWTQADIDDLAYRQVRKFGSVAVHRVYEAYVDVLYNEAPVTTVTAPGEGSTVVTTKPTVSWTYADPEGDNQERVQVKIFSAAQYGIGGFSPLTSPATYDSGVVWQSGVSLVVSVDLDNNTTYRAYVRTADINSNGRFGNFDFNQFTVTLDAPASPVLTVVVDDVLNRIALTVQGRDNLLNANESSIETDSSGWANNGNTTPTRILTQSAHGAASLQMAAVAAGQLNVISPGGLLGNPVVAGVTYTAIASLKAATIARQCKVSFLFYDVVGALISETQGATTANITTGWTQVSHTMVAPANAKFAAMTVQVLGVAANEIHYADKMSLATGTSVVWTLGGYSAIGTFTLERSVDGGVIWVVVRGAKDVSYGTNQKSTVYDYESPSGVASQYRARTSVFVTPNTLTSPNSAIVNATQTVTKFWLKVPENSALNMVVRNTTSVLSTTRSEQQGQFIPLGRNRPVVVRGALTGLSFKLGLAFIGQSDFNKFEAIREAQKTVLLQNDMGEQWYVSIDEEVEHTLSFGPERKTNPHRKVMLSLTEVEKP